MLLWLRFIDDILIFWDGSIPDLRMFFNDLNHNCLNIKLTSRECTFSGSQHTFRFKCWNFYRYSYKGHGDKLCPSCLQCTSFPPD
ncbi:hypothetical protein FKM82_024363 [Ascaphus truei]